MGIKGSQGPQGFQGSTGATGPAGPAWKGAWGSFYDTTTQNNIIGTAQAMTLNSTIPASDGVSVVDFSKITVSASGVYNLQFSAQVQSSDPHVDTIDIWLTQNGITIPYSNKQLALPPLGGNWRTVAAWNFMFDAEAGDYVQLIWSSPDVTVSLVSVSQQSGPIRPEIPAVSVTVQQIR